MKWKEDIGNILSEKGCYRLEYLYKSRLHPALKGILEHLNEFNGIQASLDHYQRREEKGKQITQEQKIYRLSISYPMDPVIYGSGMDPLNRKFIADLYFEKDVLILEVRYRRLGGNFLFQYSAEKEALEESRELNLDSKERMKKWIEGISARDIYREEMSIIEVLECGMIEKRICELYAEHIRHVEFTNR